MPRPRRTSKRRLTASENINYNPEFELPMDSTRTNQPTRKTRGTSRKSTSPHSNNMELSIIVLDDSDEECLSTIVSRSRAINENVTSKIDSFFKSSGLLSDDEDQPILSSSTASINNQIISNHNTTTITNVNEPSSSKTEARLVKTTPDEKVILIDDEINEISTREDIENYCKETEDILKSANAILEKFTGTKSQEEPSSTHSNNVKENEPRVRGFGECPICYENLSEKQVMTTKCGHVFCKVCIEKIATTIKKCPTCRKAVNKKNIIPIYI